MEVIFITIIVVGFVLAVIIFKRTKGINKTLADIQTRLDESDKKFEEAGKQMGEIQARLVESGRGIDTVRGQTTGIPALPGRFSRLSDQLDRVQRQLDTLQNTANTIQSTARR